MVISLVFMIQVKGKHLTHSEEEEFICQVTRIIEMVRRGEIVPTDVKPSATEGKSLITDTHKPPATSSQAPATVDGVTVMSSGKADFQEPRQQAPKEAAATLQKQQPSPDLAVSRLHSVDKEAAPSAVLPASQDDALLGSRKKLVAGEEKSAAVHLGSRLEVQSVMTSQTEEKHPAATTQTLPEPVSMTIY